MGPSILLTALALGMDSFAVSAVHGSSKRCFAFSCFLKLALSFSIFHFFMPIIGWAFGVGFKSYITEIDHWIAFVLLSFVGIKMIYESFSVRDEKIGKLTLPTILSLSLATSIDALIIGITFAFLSVPILFASAIISIVIFFLTILGMYLGRRFGSILGKESEILGGIVLIGLGIKILIEHLYF